MVDSGPYGVELEGGETNLGAPQCLQKESSGETNSFPQLVQNKE